MPGEVLDHVVDGRPDRLLFPANHDALREPRRIVALDLGRRSLHRLDETCEEHVRRRTVGGTELALSIPQVLRAAEREIWIFRLDAR